MAPNGEVSRFKENLELAKFVRTDDFLEWFGDWISNPESASLAVYNDTGEPVLFSHRSWTELDHGSKLSVKFDKTFQNEHGLVTKALYFTTANFLDYGPYLHKVFLNLRNPASEWSAATEMNDGVFVAGEDRGKDFYHACVFSDEQVLEISRGKDNQL